MWNIHKKGLEALLYYVTTLEDNLIWDQIWQFLEKTTIFSDLENMNSTAYGTYLLSLISVKIYWDL